MHQALDAFLELVLLLLFLKKTPFQGLHLVEGFLPLFQGFLAPGLFILLRSELLLFGLNLFQVTAGLILVETVPYLSALIGDGSIQRPGLLLERRLQTLVPRNQTLYILKNLLALVDGGPLYLFC